MNVKKRGRPRTSMEEELIEQRTKKIKVDDAPKSEIQFDNIGKWTTEKRPSDAKIKNVLVERTFSVRNVKFIYV